jgi:AcrR family transcriptional regulator
MRRKRSDEKPEPARPRRVPSGAALIQPAVTAALTRALFVEWARKGYTPLSLEAVAQRAGVGKAALYRRWPSKLAMVADRLEAIGTELAVVPDTGSLDSDIRALLIALRRLLRHPLIRRILPDLHAEMPRNPQLAEAVRNRVQVERRKRGLALLSRAIGRGELSPGTDPDMLNDALGGLIYWRMIITGGKADDAYLDRLTRFIAAALRAG